MPGWSYSSGQFAREWRYELVADFKTEAGENFPYAKPNGHVEWGSELTKIAFDAEDVHKIAASKDGNYLAVAVNNNIHIINTRTFETWQVLRGHTSRVDNIEFSPQDSNILISSAQQNRAPSSGTPHIIFWDLAETARNGLSEDDFQATVSKLAQVSIDATDAELGQPNQTSYLRHWTDAEKHDLLTSLREEFASIVTTRAVTPNNCLEGGLTGSFQGRAFSPSGSYVLFLPGSRQSCRSEGHWPIAVLHVPTRKTVAILDVHTDSIMWTGFDLSETLIATVAWDERICIWDWNAGATIASSYAEGSEPPRLEPKYTFKTDGQNWTGAFSPDSAYFVATVGTGKLHVYSMHDGSTVYSCEPGGWLRALAWEPHRKERDQTPRLCVGGYGKIELWELGRKDPVQRRKFGSKNAKVSVPNMMEDLSSWLEVMRVRYAAGGRFLITQAVGDGGVEVYDFVKEEKWRIARGGVDLDLEKASKGEIDTEYATVAHWERDGKLWIGVLTSKDLKVWAIPMVGD